MTKTNNNLIMIEIICIFTMREIIPLYHYVGDVLILIYIDTLVTYRILKTTCA